MICSLYDFFPSSVATPPETLAFGRSMQSRVFSSSTLVNGVAELGQQQVKMEDGKEQEEMEKELQDLSFWGMFCVCQLIVLVPETSSQIGRFICLTGFVQELFLYQLYIKEFLIKTC